MVGLATQKIVPFELGNITIIEKCVQYQGLTVLAVYNNEMTQQSRKEKEKKAGEV